MEQLQQGVLARADRSVSAVGLGTWQFGGDWGEVSDDDAQQVMSAAVDAGITFFDTADVYGDGRSEQLIGRFRAEHPDADLLVATKIGRRADLDPANYTVQNFRAWIDRSRRNLRTERLDLVQLHCPPTPVYSRDEVYDALDTLVQEQVIAAYGVSVETCDEALTAIARPGTASVQIVMNAFRLKPLDAVLPAAREAGVAILARVPLASGLLGGRYTRDTTFAAGDHRTYNRQGEAFDVGETFSGVDFEQGVEAAREFSELVAATLPGLTPAQAALGWVVQQPGVTAAIPGARSAEQVSANALAATLPPMPPEFGQGVRDIYDRRFRAAVHDRW